MTLLEYLDRAIVLQWQRIREAKTPAGKHAAFMELGNLMAERKRLTDEGVAA